jgi:BirA family biotin operon repressor/biotin-[acetyl-CoA-carboxylase] ligase
LYFPSVTSTNDVAAALVDGRAAEGVIVVADSQTAGRGRHGRTWFSPPGTGLYVSTILAPGGAREFSDRATALLTLGAGVALAEGIERVTGLPPDIKWPNDLLIGRRKVAGILAEAVVPAAGAALASPPGVVLGYGINVGACTPPADLGDRITSLEAELGRPIDRAVLLAETLVAVASRYGDLLDGRFDAILDAWRRRASRSLGVRVTWKAPSGPLSGITEDIDDWGALLVRVGARTERIVAGEVVWPA